MNQLTQFLLKELLDEQKTVAIYGGGFKPPTKGHFTVAKQTLEQFPEIDELKIFVGGGVRDGITQDESIKIWNIYKNYLSDKVDVEASVAPVKSVLGYAKEHPEEKVYWILGAREGDEGDLADIENRTKSLSKYPNIEVKVITSKGGVSGTKTRAAIKAGNKEQFFYMIPDISDEEKEQIWNLAEPVIKEGFMDDIKTKFQKFISSIKQEGKETKEAVSLLIKAAKGDVELSNEQKEQIGNQLKDVLKTIGLLGIAALPGGFIAAALIKLFKAEHLITPSAFVNEVGEANLKPYKWEEVDVEGYFVYTRFMTDNETQYDVDIKSTVYFPPGQMDSVPALEIEFSAKPKGAEGSSAKIVVNKGEMYRVMSTIVNIIKKYIKKSRAEAIIYSPSKKSDEESFGTQRDNLYRAFISKAFPGTTFKQSGDYITAILPNNAALTLEEGKQVGPLYHYTSADGLKGILSSNRINASEEYYLGNDLYYISFTRNKNFHNKGSKFGVKTDYRITLDGNKLSNRYKITPFAYKPGWNYEDNWEYDWLEDEPESVVRDFFNNTGDYDEQEERISFKGPEGGIDNIKNYILSVDKVEDLQEATKRIPQTTKSGKKRPASKHSDLYTDEDPKGTITGLGFKDSSTARAGITKINKAKTTHAHKVQATLVMKQRAKAAIERTKDPEKKKKLQAAYRIWSDKLEQLKRKTKSMKKENVAPNHDGKAAPYGSGFAPIKENYQFKISDKDYDSEDNSLITVTYKFSTPDNTYRVEFYSGEYSSESKTFDVSFGLDKGYNSKLDTFQMTGEGNALSILKTIVNIIIDFTNKFEVNKLVINPTSEKRGRIYSMILKSLPSNILNKIELINEKSNDPFGLKEFVKEVFKKDWNLKEGMLSLTKYMMDNGMNITPLPKIKVIKDDKENASHLLGKTAYYNPTDKSITLYTLGRHPKDVLRSFSHEMVHHMQNIEGRLGNINTTNTNEDGDLPEIEREAYEKGNMMLRNWEDSIKNV